MAHVPVLAKEVMGFLDPKPNENFVDCTLGDGGHCRRILESTSPHGRVLGFDLDSEAVEVARKNLHAFGERLVAIHSSYAELSSVVAAHKFGPIHGLLADLGFSSPQLEGRMRGLSFQRDEPLDMRYDAKNGTLRAAEIVNGWTRPDLVRILREYGEERMSERVADAVIAARRAKRIISTFELAEIVKSALPKGYERGRIHPATRTFQALRIAANDELGSVKSLLPQALRELAPGGRMVIISFHSLEDRLVKDFMKEEAAKGAIEILTKKPVIASDEEIRSNPRSRSAKLRAARKK